MSSTTCSGTSAATTTQSDASARLAGAMAAGAMSVQQAAENLSAASWYINALGVQPEARGRGLGARLLAEADALARAAGLDAVSLIASDVNVGAIRLYERNGFEVVASRPKVGFEGWTPEGRDWLLMLRRGLG